ncbi:NOP5/NOP56 family protein [Methanobacterium aggregans]|uniref:NOP5/NOP56 family protein n=1 Tax=Methanobacterium aggregans TaxID=1615586 RepID=UPI001AE38349|nr:ATP-binding protein [Methanobacterium aggregans]
MKCYLTSCFAGFIILDENCTLIDYELFPRSKLAEKLLEIENGNLTREEESLLKRIVKKFDSVVIETNLPHSKYKNLKDSSKFLFETPSIGGEFLRSNTAHLLEKTGFNLDDGFETTIHDVLIGLTEKKLMESSEAEDLLLIQAINAIDDLDETTGKLVERVREWYSVHFPELDRVRNHESYVKLVAEYGDRDAIIDSGLLNSEMGLKKGIDKSIGAEIGETDLRIIKGFAESLKSLQESRNSITEYVDTKMKEIAPNLRDLCGYSLGAKLIAHVGSIRRLSMLPSSTVQILGAEKALFRHLKTGENPPKHGLIYQHPDVRGAKWWIRGKVARTLAAKISLAVRKDVFSGEYDPTIKENFEIKVKEIEKDNPFPKRSTASSKPDKKKDKKKKKKKDKYKKKISDYY